MDAALVREFVLSLADRADDDGTVARMRGYLEALGRPDVRYLVAVVRGGGAPTILRYARGVLAAAGASVGAIDDPLDDALLARAGTSVAATAYPLARTLGDLSRREATTLVAFVAHAEASRRVLLLADPDLEPRAPIHGAVPDVVAAGRMADEPLAAAIAAAPERRPFVIAPRAEGTAAAIAKRDLPYLLGGREFHVRGGGARMTLEVGDERYGDLALGPGDDAELAATGIVTALAVAAFGVRMRSEWVERGAGLAAARQ